MTWLLETLGVLIGVALIGELVLRVASSKLPPPLQWHSWEAQNKVAAMQALAREGGASVVIIGSSDMNAAADADAMTEMLRGGRPVFNAALNGSTLRTMELWTNDVVIPLLKPDVVVLGVQTMNLNDNTYGGMRSVKQLRRSVGWRRAHSPKSAARRLSLFLEHSYLFRFRRFLFEPTIARRRRFFRIQRFVNDPFFHFRGARVNLASVTRLGMLQAAWVFSATGYEVPDHLAQIWTKQYLNDYHIGGVELAAFRRLIEGARSASVDVLVVQVPFTDDWISFSTRGVHDYDAFTDTLRSTTAELGVPFLDMSPGFSRLDHREVFAHPIHLNFTGRRYFTDVLLERLQALRSSDGKVVQKADRE